RPLALAPFRGGRRRVRVGLRGLARRRRAIAADGEDHLPDLHFLARLDLDIADRAVDRRRHFDRRLVGLELEYRLIDLDGVAALHQHAQHIAAVNVFTEFGEFEVRHEAMLKSVVLKVQGCQWWYGCWCKGANGATGAGAKGAHGGTGAGVMGAHGATGAGVKGADGGATGAGARVPTVLRVLVQRCS